MKKFLPIILSLILLTVFTACSSSTKESSSEQNNIQASEKSTDADILQEEISNIVEDIKNGTITDFSRYSQIEQEAIIDAVKAQGGSISIDDNGKVTYINNSTEPTTNTTWPDNEYTKLLPEPDMDIINVTSNENIFAVTVDGCTMEKAKAYIKELKDFGFTKNVAELDQKDGSYIFAGGNDDGHIATLTKNTDETGVIGIQMSDK